MVRTAIRMSRTGGERLCSKGIEQPPTVKKKKYIKIAAIGKRKKLDPVGSPGGER